MYILEVSPFIIIFDVFKMSQKKIPMKHSALHPEAFPLLLGNSTASKNPKTYQIGDYTRFFLNAAAIQTPV